MHQIRSNFLVQKNVTILFLHKRADFCLQIILNSHPFYLDLHYCRHHPPQKSQNIGINCLVYVSRGNTSDILLSLTLKDNSSQKSKPSSRHNSVSLGFDKGITMQRVARLRSYESESLLFYTVSQWHSVTLWHTVSLCHCCFTLFPVFPSELKKCQLFM